MGGSAASASKRPTCWYVKTLAGEHGEHIVVITVFITFVACSNGGDGLAVGAPFARRAVADALMKTDVTFTTWLEDMAGVPECAKVDR